MLARAGFRLRRISARGAAGLRCVSRCAGTCCATRRWPALRSLRRPPAAVSLND